MKIFVQIVVILTFTNIAHSQHKKIKVFDEFAVWTSLTVPFISNHFLSYIGGGGGAYHTFRKEKKFQVISGLEFNYLSYYKDEKILSHSDYWENIYRKSMYFTFPVFTRFNFGKKVKFMIDLGAFFDLAFFDKINATQYHFGLYSGSKNKITARGYLDNNTGFSLGFGIKIPTEKVNFIVKFDYKFCLLPTIREEFFSYCRVIFAVSLR